MHLQPFFNFFKYDLIREAVQIFKRIESVPKGNNPLNLRPTPSDSNNPLNLGRSIEVGIRLTKIDWFGSLFLFQNSVIKN